MNLHKKRGESSQNSGVGRLSAQMLVYKRFLGHVGGQISIDFHKILGPFGAIRNSSGSLSRPPQGRELRDVQPQISVMPENRQKTYIFAFVCVFRCFFACFLYLFGVLYRDIGALYKDI